MKRSLFGGTLLAAGLTTGATAQFSFNYASWAKTFSNDYAGGLDQDYFFDVGGFVLESTTSGDLVNAHGLALMEPFRIRTEATLSTTEGATGGAYGRFSGGYFTVSQDTAALAEWDWTAWNGDLSVFDITMGSSLLYAYGNVSGSAPLDLVAGHKYYVGGASAVWGQGDHATYWQVTIPGPGPAGVLGVVGIAAVRRRRPVAARGGAYG